MHVAAGLQMLTLQPTGTIHSDTASLSLLPSRVPALIAVMFVHLTELPKVVLFSVYVKGICASATED